MKTTTGAGIYRFGAFRLDCGQRLLMHRGRRVTLRSKAFDLLELLACSDGRLVDKAALLATLWPGIAVHENNIAVTVRSLRKALYEHDPALELIETVPGRGYRLASAMLPIVGSPAPLATPSAKAVSRPPSPWRGEPGTDLRREGLEPFVAREPELARLEALWAAARDGAGQVVFVSGEPGIGKSALVQRFVERALVQAPLSLALQGQCIPLFGLAEPHLPWREALAAGLSSPACAELLEALRLYAPGWCARLPPALVGAGHEQTQPQRAAHAGALELVEALRAAATSRPLLLVLEDLHWADASSIDVLRWLDERVGARPLLVVGTYRPAELQRGQHPLRALLDDRTARGRQLSLALGPWRTDEIESYLAARLGDTLIAATLAPVIERRSEGLPLLAVRLVDSLLAGGPLRETRSPRRVSTDVEEGPNAKCPIGSGSTCPSPAQRGRGEPGTNPGHEALLRPDAAGGWVLALPAEAREPRVPESVAALIARELEWLPSGSRGLLELASVEGAEFGTALLSGVLGASAAEVESALERLVEQGWLERLGEGRQVGRGASEGERLQALRQPVDARRRAVDVRYRFRHVLYRDHLYERLGSHRRVELHGAVARAQLANGASPSRLAFHFERGRDFSRAVALWTQAGDDADRAFAKLEALECYQRAAPLLDELPAGERALRRLVLEHGRGWANHGLSRASAARHHFLEFARLARELSTAPEVERQTALTLASEYFERPWSDVVLRRPAGIFPKAAAGDVASELLAEALHCCCHAADTEGRADDLRSHARALEDVALASRSPSRRAEALAWLGVHALHTGRAERARRRLDEALRLARALDHERALRVALGRRAWLHRMQGELERAQLAYEELYRRVPDASSAAGVLSELGTTLAGRGQPSAALDAYARADGFRQRIAPGHPSLHGWLLGELGQLDRARELDAFAVANLRAQADRWLLVRLLSSLAITSCRQGDRAAACEQLREAQALVADDARDCSWRRGPLWSAQCELSANAGDAAMLQRTARRWLRSARVRADAEGMKRARRWLALGLAQAGDVQSAVEQLAPGLDATGALPVPLVDWRCRALLHQLALRAGDVGLAARAHGLAKATINIITRGIDDRADRRCFEQMALAELGSLLAPVERPAAPASAGLQRSRKGSNTRSAPVTSMLGSNLPSGPFASDEVREKSPAGVPRNKRRRAAS
jgi:DNA-binding winged helix-turn-helix (wHTH) protein/tetratricopeptide (TPR) repeat protein